MEHIEDKAISDLYERCQLRKREGSYDEAATSQRKILEYMVENIWISGTNGAPWPKDCRELFKKINLLEHMNFISQESKNQYHSIRKKTNSGAHVANPVSENDVNAVLMLLEPEILKYFNQYGGADSLKIRRQLAEKLNERERQQQLLLQERWRKRKKGLAVGGVIVLCCVVIFFVGLRMLQKVRMNAMIQEEISNYVESPLNHFSLKVGETSKPLAARGWKWVDTYTSNEKVVKVSSKGKVVAVGEGSAYVVISSKIGLGKLVECYRYDVNRESPTKEKAADAWGQFKSDESTENTEEKTTESTKAPKAKVPSAYAQGYRQIKEFVERDPHWITTLQVGDAFTVDCMKVWKNAGVSTYSTNKKVVTVDAAGRVKAVGKGTAYVIIAVSDNVQQGYCYRVE